MQEDRPGLRNESERKRERLKRERPYWNTTYFRVHWTWRGSLALSLCSLGGGDAFNGWRTGESEKEDKWKRQRWRGWERVRSSLYLVFCFFVNSSLALHTFFLSFFLSIHFSLLVDQRLHDFTRWHISLSRSCRLQIIKLCWGNSFVQSKNNVSKNTINNVNTAEVKHGFAYGFRFCEVYLLVEFVWNKFSSAVE